MSAQFGLDIGSYSIKLIQTEKKGKNFKLITFGEVRTPADINSDSEKDKLTIATVIRKLCLECKVSTKNVVLALPESEVFSQVIELPPLSEDELANAISFEAEQYIPVPLAEVQFEYLILKNPAKGSMMEKTEILVVAAKKTSLERIISIVEKSGLNPIAAETEMLAINRIFANDINKTKILINIGHRSTEILIISNNIIKAVRTIPIGGEAFTRAIATFLNMNDTQAEQYKILYGLNNAQLEGKVAKAIMPSMNTIIDEIKRLIAFFSQKQNNEAIELMILSGGSAEMAGLSSFFAQIFNIEIMLVNPMDKFEKPANQIKIEHSAKFCVAAGLSIREDD